jgi:predicted dehydrogenase
MADRLRAGIIGVGLMGEVHARAVRATCGTVQRVAASTPRRSAEAATRLGAEAAAPGAAQLIAADDVDVVHVCTPNAWHAEHAAAALAAGKHVICEKPLALDRAQATALAETARRAGVLAAVPFVYRYYASVREARARIAAGEPGQLRLLHGSYLQDWLSSAEDTNWRVDPDVGGRSRAFADIGVHWCDLMEFTTGHRITRLVARTLTSFPYRPAANGSAGRSPVETEDAVSVLFDTDRGATGSVVISQVSPGRKNRLWFSFDGTDAGYCFDQELPEGLWVGGRNENRVLHRGAAATSASARRYSFLPPGHPQGYQDCFDAFIAEAYGAVLAGGGTEIPAFDDGARAAAITEAVIRSARTGAWTEVSP